MNRWEKLKNDEEVSNSLDYGIEGKIKHTCWYLASFVYFHDGSNVNFQDMMMLSINQDLTKEQFRISYSCFTVLFSNTSTIKNLKKFSDQARCRMDLLLGSRNWLPSKWRVINAPDQINQEQLMPYSLQWPSFRFTVERDLTSSSFRK